MAELKETPSAAVNDLLRKSGFGLAPVNASEGALQQVETVKPARQETSGAEADGMIEIDREKENIRSHLAEGEMVDGTLMLKHGISIAGTVTGEVRCESGTIVIESTGSVGGGVRSNGRILVDGLVGKPDEAEKNDSEHPAVRTPGLLVVLGNGRVYGRHEYGRIATYDDATIEGMGKKIKD